MEVTIIALIIIVIICYKYKNRDYQLGAYYQVTKNPYSSVKYDKNKYAEYLIYKTLRHFENSGSKFLFNIFVPKSNDETTEIDVLLISPKGLFVFECKDYSGWIFGNEAHKRWTQTLPQGWGRCHKESFYNPIMQNASHIRHLKNLVGRNVPMRSIIVFSDRCVLKDIIVKNNDIRVINHYDLESVVIQICNQIPIDIFTAIEVNDIYNKFYPYTQVDDAAKEQHIENIRKKFNLNEVKHDGSNINTQFSNWQKVTHRQFGEGVVLQQEGWGNLARLQVKFARAGVKWVLASYVVSREAPH